MINRDKITSVLQDVNAEVKAGAPQDMVLLYMQVAARHAHKEHEGDWAICDPCNKHVTGDVEDYHRLVVALDELHWPRSVNDVPGMDESLRYCRECSHVWPCATARVAGLVPDDGGNGS